MRVVRMAGCLRGMARQLGGAGGMGMAEGPPFLTSGLYHTSSVFVKENRRVFFRGEWLSPLNV
jgi:hypothetical protein